MFAAFGGTDDDMNIILNVGFEQQEQLLKDDRFFSTPFAAHRGWVSLRIDGKTDWEEIEGLLREAYRQVALKRMLKELDGDRRAG